MGTILVFIVASIAVNHVAAQSEEMLRKAFEGRRVALKIDMPGTADGVDIAVGSRRN